MDSNKIVIPAAAESEQNPRQRFGRAEASGMLALVISFLAFATGAYQTHLMQGQARAGVWPYLAIGFSYANEGEHAGFSWHINNNGVGPAKIQSVVVTLDGKPIKQWGELLAAVLPTRPLDHVSTTSINGIVLPPNTNRETEIQAIFIPTSTDGAIMNAATSRLGMEICYCSVYDDCWTARWLEHGVKPVDRCSTAGTVQFEQ